MVNQELPARRTRTEPQHGKLADSVPNRRFIVIRNGRGIIADGDDMAQLESAYVKAAQDASGTVRSDRSALGGHGFPPFASLTRCDHEGETGKVCIVDAEQAADSVRSYYGVGFVD